MEDLKWDVPNTEEVQLDEEELAELDQAIADADNGRTYSIEEVRKMIPEWISRYASQPKR
jgi:predicted transcriptional regulator